VSRPGVLLDRDGTLVDFFRDPELGAVISAFHPDQLRLLPGTVEGLRLLQEGGYVLGMATNQPGAAKGQIPERAIHRTNEALLVMLADQGVRIDAVEVCLHHPEGGPGGDPALVCDCDCRKPRPGMLARLMARLDLDPARSWMIGDAAVDVAAARAAGLRAGLLFEAGRCEMCPLRMGAEALGRSLPDAAAPRLDALARLILGA
jgi:D-glycero-D-manno-heptose 1,7-bisphosphate phosphatase